MIPQSGHIHTRGSRHRLHTHPISVVAIIVLFLSLTAIVCAANTQQASSGVRLFARQRDEQHRSSAVATGTPTSTGSASRPSSPVSATKDGNGTSSSNSSSSSSSSLSPSNSSSIIRGPTIGGSGESGLIDPRRPVSRLSMLQPKQNTASPPLFAVGNNIVFEWAFDNQTLVFPPANLTIEVSLTANPKTIWPVANVTGTTTSVVWNTASVNQPPLSMGFYMVSVYDPKLGKQGVATSGHLMPYSDLQIGLYIPEPYIPRSGAYCETCNAGAQLDPATSFWGWHLVLLLCGLIVSNHFPSC